MPGVRMAFLAADRDGAARLLEGAWAGCLASSPDLDGRDLGYEANWRGTLGLAPEDVRACVSRASVLLSRGSADASGIAAAYRRESAAAWADGDDLRAFETEAVAEYCEGPGADGFWEASTEDTLLPPEFLTQAAGVLDGVAWKE